MRKWAGGVAALLVWLAMQAPVAAAAAAARARIALFGFEMTNTSLQPTSPAERTRLQLLDRELRAALEKSGKYEVVDITPARTEIEQLGSIRTCNGCELPVARKLGATEVAYGWVDKVSNLILDINLEIENAQTGKILRGGRVDIRGNTDESWTRGLKFLLEEHVFDH